MNTVYIFLFVSCRIKLGVMTAVSPNDELLSYVARCMRSQETAKKLYSVGVFGAACLQRKIACGPKRDFYSRSVNC